VENSLAERLSATPKELHSMELAVGLGKRADFTMPRSPIQEPGIYTKDCSTKECRSSYVTEQKVGILRETRNSYKICLVLKPQRGWEKRNCIQLAQHGIQ
jgi:hypothetical protein